MSPSDDLQRELLQTFAQEVKETLQRVNDLLLQLEKGGSSEEEEARFSQIFREAHNLKGAARAVGILPISQIAHALETLFSLVRRGEIEASPDLYDLVYQAVDAIGLLAAASGTAHGAMVRIEVNVDEIVLGLDAISAAPSATVGSEKSDTSSEPVVEEPAVVPPLSGPLPGPLPVPLPGPLPVPVATQANGESPAAESEPVSAPAPKAAPARAAEPGVDETIRVATARLDQIMAQMGELQVVRNSLAHVLSDLRGLLEEVNNTELSRRRTSVRQRTLAPAVQRQGHQLEAGNGNGNGFSGTGEQINHVLNQSHLRILTESLAERDANAGQVRAGINKIYRRLKLEDHRMGQVVAGLQEDVRRTRLQPVSTVFDAFPRMVRDIARSQGKEIDFIVEGGETEMDRSLNERIKAPLVHLLRNAIDHGIENPQNRQSAHKIATATLRLTAAQQGSNITISVQDDGQGIDVERVVAKAQEKGLISAEEAKTIDRQDALWLIFRSGFSTAEALTDISGRGIGMDVVRSQVEEMHGIIDVATERGKGTIITLTLPLTVATTLVMLVKSGGLTFAIPVSNVNRIMRVGSQEIGYLEGNAVIHVEGQPTLLTHLGQLLDLGKDVERKNSAYVIAVVLGSAERRAALSVDELLGIQEVVVKSLPAPFLRVRNVAGATILGTGDAVPILNVADLLRTARRSSAGFLPAIGEEKAIKERQPWILVADDSVTTRTLEKNILEGAGYRVRAASDGQEAWEILQSQSFDLLVSDVNMPRMDGLKLTQTIRKADKFQTLPIILVTSLESAEDRKRGIDAGADAYIVKGGFDQQHLLETVQSLI